MFVLSRFLSKNTCLTRRVLQAIFVANKSKAGAAASPFVVAAQIVGIKVLDHVINAAILVFVLSASNSDLYIGSRTLYGLAAEGKAPKIFARVNRLGVPWPSLIVCTLMCGLVFLNVSSSSSKGERQYVFYLRMTVLIIV